MARQVDIEFITGHKKTALFKIPTGQNSVNKVEQANQKKGVT